MLLPKAQTRHERVDNAREEALVVRALVEFVDGVYITHGCNIAEHNLVRSNADDRPIRFEEELDCLALLEP